MHLSELRSNWFQRDAIRQLELQRCARSFGIEWEDTVVFGDSNNDLSMFEYAATKVAMGNGSPKIRELADYVTTDMFHYGIQNGLTKLGLI